MNTKLFSVRVCLLLLLLVSGLLAAGQVGMAHRRLVLAGQQTAAQREVRQLHAEISRLTLELATISRPERLRRIAISKLGMRPPTPMQVIRP